MCDGPEAGLAHIDAVLEQGELAPQPNVKTAIGDQSEGRAGVKSAGVSIDETDAHGMRIARAMDVVVNNFYRDNAAVLAEWETARHVERAPKRKKATLAEPPKSSTPNA
jgi:hypothetical protein